MPDVDFTEENKRKVIENNKEEFISRVIGFGGSPTHRLKPVYPSGILEFGEDKIFYQTILLPSDSGFKPFVVTSRFNIIEVTEEGGCWHFGYNGEKFKFRGEPFFIDNLGINTAVLGSRTDASQSKDIYDDMKDTIRNYFDHHNSYEYDIAVAFAFQSYIKRALGRAFYYVLQGRENTGKSTLQKIFAKLQFNGMFVGKGTVATTSRLIHCLDVNLNQDEFDKMGDDERRAFIGQANTGLYADGTYMLTDMNKSKISDQIRVLNTFSSRSFSANSLHEFDRSFLSRCYVLTATRQGRKLGDMNSISSKEEAHFQELRNRAFLYCLSNWEEMRRDIDQVKMELEAKGIFGRRTDMNSIILGVVKHFKGGYYKDVESCLREKEGLEEEENSGTDECIVFEYMMRRALDGLIEVSNKEIYDHLLAERGIKPDAEKKPPPQRIGWILKRHGLVERRDNLRRGSKGNRIYVINREDLLDRLKRFGYNELVKRLEDSQTPSSVSSDTSASSEQIPEETEQTEDTEVGLWEKDKKTILEILGKEEKGIEDLKDEYFARLPSRIINPQIFWNIFEKLKSLGLIFEVTPGRVKAVDGSFIGFS